MRRDPYEEYVEHPLYGRGARLTGANPETVFGGNVFLHWNAAGEDRIPGTAIAADVARQTPATVAVTHYYDVRRTCVDCGRRFIFFAEEQKHWYEDLGFRLEVDCIRCVPCRRRHRGPVRSRRRYEELFHVSPRTPEEELEMVACILDLVKAGLFHPRKLEHAQAGLRRAGDDGAGREGLQQRLDRLRAGGASGDGTRPRGDAS